MLLQRCGWSCAPLRLRVLSPSWCRQMAFNRNSAINTPPSQSSGLYVEMLDLARVSLDPKGEQSKPPEVRWKERSEQFFARNLRPNDAYTGRTVDIRNRSTETSSLSSAWGALHRTLRNNNVRVEIRARERFENPGEKKRRLKSERWRRRFAEEVRNKVRLVNEIKRRGA